MATAIATATVAAATALPIRLRCTGSDRNEGKPDGAGSRCAVSDRCVESCAGYGRICPCTARAAGRAAHDKVQSILTDSAVFANKPDLHTIDPGDIVVGRKLGEGGFAEVNACTVKNDGTEDQYAVKYLKLQTMMEAKHFRHGAADLATEAFFLSAIEHPNFIRFKGVTSGSVERNVAQAKERGFFVVVERLEGTLEERIRKWRHEAENEHPGLFTRMSNTYKEKQRLRLMERLLVALDIANAMEHLHSRNLVFRDLKPDNVGFDSSGTVKLFDLGLVRELKPKHRDGATDCYRMTGHTGSRRYMSPEVAKSETYNEKVDVYSFGILLWEICALEKPFQGYSSRKHMNNVIKGGERPKMDSSHVSNWPVDLQWLIKSCWAESPVQRPSFPTIRKSLEEIIHETTHAPTSPKRQSRARSVGIRTFIHASDENVITSLPTVITTDKRVSASDKIEPPSGGFRSFKKPNQRTGRNWSLGFRRGG